VITSKTTTQNPGLIFTLKSKISSLILKDIEEILANAMKIASTFLVDSLNSKLHLKDL